MIPPRPIKWICKQCNHTITHTFQSDDLEHKDLEMLGFDLKKDAQGYKAMKTSPKCPKCDNDMQKE